MRLIDADKCPCKECLSEFHCNNTYCAEFEEWLQKPVYDIDKVVEELEYYKSQYEKIALSINDEVERRIYIAKDATMYNAIEIVKQQLKGQNEQNSIIEDLKPRGCTDMPKEIVCNCTKEQEKIYYRETEDEFEELNIEEHDKYIRAEERNKVIEELFNLDFCVECKAPYCCYCRADNAQAWFIKQLKENK